MFGKILLFLKVTAKYIAIIAHSYVGYVTINLCRSFPESFQKRVFAIAFTDSCHNFVSQDLTASNIEWFHKTKLAHRDEVMLTINLDDIAEMFEELLSIMLIDIRHCLQKLFKKC
ncbi:protein FAM172A [Caerostris darwini]|uniref:Protein FAM172A n=1 Tax=Caerostris darwini TaxID=1538125 RepID=A0AAV4TAH7_9ARAC|nr:protein FAM172A [Caerostris darwini]